MPGFLIFLFYCMGCFLVLGYFFNDLKKDHEHIPSLHSTLNKNTTTPKKTIKNTTLIQEGIDFKENQNTIDSVRVESINTSDDEVPLSNQKETSNVKDIKQASLKYEALPFSVFNEASEAVVPCNLFTRIYKNRSNVKIPYACINYGMEIKKILTLYKESSLTLTGYSSPEEPSDLGKQRAEYIKKLLLGIGIDRSRLHTNASFQDINYINGVAKGGVLMRINNIDPLFTSIIPTNKEVTIKTTQPDGPYAYKKFTTGFKGDYFYSNQTFTSYISLVKSYLKDNPSKKIEIYTYTDPVGNAIDNMSISKTNSETAQRIVAQSGIPAHKIKSIAMGDKIVDGIGNNKCVILKVK